eukprot:TRINITY_DN29_c2_g1_i1.p1 TRINITY_DN29_c2_g1~~TRINITY_DN29_c2_g1_i1.p1  ORF type:complete len:123 (-),score=38.92 TRINITY_DN29_c2_g1_i1:80-448(-)
MSDDLKLQQAQQAQEARRQQEEQRQFLASQLLTPEARERLNRVALVKPDKAKMVENHIIMQAKSGRLNEKVSEDLLIQMLDSLNTQEEQHKPKVEIKRRKATEDSDDDNFGLDDDDDDGDDW